MDKHRNLEYDYDKGFAILLIVIGHMYFYSGRSDNSWVWLVCNTIQIPIFMYISGIFACRSHNKYNMIVLIKKRALRLLLPFMSFYFLWGLYNFDKFRGLPLDQFKQGLWFTFVLFEIDILFSFSKYCANKYSHPVLLYHTLIFLLISCFVIIAPKENVLSQLFSVNLIWHYYPFFMLGYYSSYLNFFIKLKYAPLYIIVYIIALYFLYKCNIKFLTPICNTTSLLFTLTLTKRFRPLEDSFTKLGLYSLQIYLLHFWCIHFIIPHLPIIENCWIEFGEMICFALAFIFISIALSKLFEKNKWLNLLLFGISPK